MVNLGTNITNQPTVYRIRRPLIRTRRTTVVYKMFRIFYFVSVEISLQLYASCPGWRFCDLLSGWIFVRTHRYPRTRSQVARRQNCCCCCCNSERNLVATTILSIDNIVSHIIAITVLSYILQHPALLLPLKISDTAKTECIYKHQEETLVGPTTT